MSAETKLALGTGVGEAPADRPVDVARLQAENEGLVDEVLRSYEQLNLIFDVTAQLAYLTNAREVKRLLLDRLCEMLRSDWSGCIAPSGALDVHTYSDRAPPSGRYLQELLEEVRRTRRVVVGTLPNYDAKPEPTHVMLGPLTDGNRDAVLVVCLTREGREFEAGDMLLLDSVLTYGGHVLRNLHLLDRLKRTSFETVRALVNAIDKKDAYTCGHSERVGILARMTGREMNMSADELQQLEWAGLLHDIGKIGIPGHILNKEGKLTAEEYDIIKQHAQMSYDVLKPVEMLGSALRAVVEHHENWDGTGYPRGLRGEEISLGGRILRVVDFFDALTSTRSYRKAFDVERALQIACEDAGTKLDPKVVEAFLLVVDRIRSETGGLDLEDSSADEPDAVLSIKYAAMEESGS